MIHPTTRALAVTRRHLFMQKTSAWPANTKWIIQVAKSAARGYDLKINGRMGNADIVSIDGKK